MPDVDRTERTDSNGRLVVEHDFGAENAGRDVHIALELHTPPSSYRGSRKHILDVVAKADFRDRMNRVIGNGPVVLDVDSQPVPAGSGSPAELDLDTYIRKYLGNSEASKLKNAMGCNWWAPYGGTRPQMDLICKASVKGRPGILFVEAKAHEGELDWGGKPLADDASEGSVKNHENILLQISAANEQLNTLRAGFNLSIGSHYQLVNRLTYLWKLASVGIPVALLFLGFLKDEYFPDDYLRDEAHWLRVMGGYLEGAVPQSFPEQAYWLGDAPLSMLIRSVECIEQAPRGR